jgi:site-specific DNA-methyltransferase (adenine-specific)
MARPFHFTGARLERVETVLRMGFTLPETVRILRSKGVQISVPTLRKIAREMGITFKRGRPLKPKPAIPTRPIEVETDSIHTSEDGGHDADWCMSNIEIICGDCVQVMRERIADSSVSVVATSPPYNQKINYRTYNDDRDETEYLDWLSTVFVEIARVLKPDGSFFLIIGYTPKNPWKVMKVAEAAGKHFVLQNQITWVKSITIDDTTRGHFTPIQGERFLNRAWEYVFHFTKTGSVPLERLAAGVPYQYEINAERTGSNVRCGGDTWFIPHNTIHKNEDRAGHPATFPPELAERCIKLAGVKKDMLVLDPFCGVNGMVAASRLGVRGIGIDIDPEYCEAARKRVAPDELPEGDIGPDDLPDLC